MAVKKPTQIPPGYTSEQDRALRLLTYGTYVVSSADREGTPQASTVAWVSQASFQPPLVMVAVQSDSRLNDSIGVSGKFAINVLGNDQLALAERYIRHATYVPPVPEDFETGEFDVPVLKAAPGFLECQVVDSFTEGDHAIIVGSVETGLIRDDAARPLMLSDTPWTYGGLMGRE